jgi:putative DNA primase/helicase
MFIHAAGDTTEAGLRQRLRTDALPVLFDEFESEREKAAQKTQDVLSLVRQSSSDTGAEIIKGGANGKDDSYQIRSMFAFASISVNLSGDADESRLTVLSMKGSTEADRADENFQNHWIRFQRMITETLTEEYVHRLQARAIRMIPIIRQNIKSFSDAIAQSPKLGGRRLGDQVGTLLAGAYSLYSSKPIDLDGALAWINQQDWSAVSNTESEGDERECISYIMSHHIRTEGRMAVQTLTVAELIDIAAGYEAGTDNIDGHIADKTLPRYGIRVKTVNGIQRVIIATDHKKLEEMLRHSGYAGWGRILLRMPGAEKTKSTRFASIVKRGVSIPIEVIRGIEEDI